MKLASEAQSPRAKERSALQPAERETAGGMTGTGMHGPSPGTRTSGEAPLSRRAGDGPGGPHRRPRTAARGLRESDRLVVIHTRPDCWALGRLRRKGRQKDDSGIKAPMSSR